MGARGPPRTRLVVLTRATSAHSPRISRVVDVDGPFQSCVQRTPQLSEIISATQKRLSKVWLFRNKYIIKRVNKYVHFRNDTSALGTERDPVSGVPHQGTCTMSTMVSLPLFLGSFFPPFQKTIKAAKHTHKTERTGAISSFAAGWEFGVSILLVGLAQTRTKNGFR